MVVVGLQTRGEGIHIATLYINRGAYTAPFGHNPRARAPGARTSNI